MVLIIGNTIIDSCPESTDQLFRSHSHLVSQAERWHREAAKLVPEEGMLYVAQREFAVVPGADDRVKIVGSDDATTCHIIIFHHRESGNVALAHCDGSYKEEASILNFLQLLVGDSNEPAFDVYAIGGFYKTQSRVVGLEESQKLSLKYLNLFVKLDFQFNLIQWCCCELNTAQTASAMPLFFGLCWDRMEKCAKPAVFTSHGNNATLRAASMWSTYSNGMVNLYDYNKHSITIQPFSNTSNNPWHIYRTLSDEMILQNFSTSPTAEPPMFCSRMRRLFGLLADNPYPMKSIFPDGKPKVYVLQEAGCWELQLQ